MGGDGAGEHLLFQLIANHDVQAVGELIGLGADQRGPGAVHHTVELLLRHVLQLGGEMLLQPRQQDGAEGPAAADDVLVEQDWLSWMPMETPFPKAGAGQLPAGVELIEAWPPSWTTEYREDAT